MAQPGTHTRIARLEGPHRLVWAEDSLPATAPEGCHRCETLVSAISPGTELAAWTGAPPLRPGPVYPRVNGYCNVARVLESAPGTRHAQPGDRVLSFTSHRSHFDLADADVLAVIPDSLSSEAASVAYLYHLGYNSILRADVRPGSRVLVVGLGALGMAAVSMAHLAGADVAAVSGQPALRDMALKAGARVASPRQEFAAEAVWPARQGQAAGADVVVLTTGSWDDWRFALQAATVRGTVAVLGFPGRGLPMPADNPLDPQYFYLKQLRIEAVGMSPEIADSRGFLPFNERANLAWIMDLLANGRLDPSGFTRHVAPASTLAAVYDQLLARTAGQLTSLLSWQ